MNKNPFLNAILAIGYIVVVVFVIHFGSSLAENGSDSLFIPMAMLSLFVLSAAVMGYLFVMQPLAMYLDGKKPEAVTFFMRTVATFAAITFMLLVLAFTVSALL